MGRPCCGRSGSSVLESGFQLDTLVRTHTVEQTYTQFRPVSGLRQRRSCVSHGAPVLFRQPATASVTVQLQSAKCSTSQPEPPAPSGRRDLQFFSRPVLTVPNTDRMSIYSSCPVLSSLYPTLREGQFTVPVLSCPDCTQH
jgi:hypothetical protein